MINDDRNLAPPGTLIAPRRNLRTFDRSLSVLGGSLLAILAVRQRGPTGILLGVMGSALFVRGVTGISPIKRLVGSKPDELSIAEEKGWSSAAILSRAVTINAPRDAVYSHLRDFARWPDWSVNVQSVTVARGGELNFVTKEPAGVVCWKAAITEEQDGAVLAIASDEDSTTSVTMRYELRDAPGGRGTEVHGVIAYQPPGGIIGRYVAKLTEREPGIQLRRDLKRFKSLIETGEIAVSGPQGAEPRA